MEIETAILDGLNRIIEQYITFPELKEIALSSVRAKAEEGFPFAKLAEIHYRMHGGTTPEIFPLATAVESTILALDIFDDLQDQDSHLYPWNKIDQALAMNLAIGFGYLGLKSIGNLSLPPQAISTLIAVHHEQILAAVNGQHADLLNDASTEEAYIEMIRNKSGSLVALACLSGTIAATGSFHPMVKKYAEHIGISAQIQNDIKDLNRWDQKGDFFAKKKTLPILYLLHKQQPEWKMINDYFEGNIGKEEIIAQKETMEQILSNSGAVEYALVIKRIHQLQAIEMIKNLDGDPECKEQLFAMI